MFTRPRYTYAQYQALKLFQSIPADLLRFPLDVKSVIKTIDCCKISSYKAFACRFGISVEDVIALCSSKSGCTHYEISSKKYLVLYNDSCADYNVDGRQLWTLAHELAHIVLKHLLLKPESSAAENSFGVKVNPVVESEADYFASQILAPYALFGPLNITSSIDVEYMFGLSTLASSNQYRSYRKWKERHIKTSIDNDLVKLFALFVNEAHF